MVKRANRVWSSIRSGLRKCRALWDTTGVVVIVFSLAGVGVLYGIAVTSFVEPPYVPLDAVAAGTHEGAFIRTTGVVTEFRITEYGTVLMISGNNTELPVFVAHTCAEPLSYGDEIEVQGRVQLYNGRYELVSTGNIIKKAFSDNTSFVSQIAVRPEVYEGKRVHIVGYAGDVYTHVFYLCDASGNYCMRVKVGDSHLSAVQKGDKIIAGGVFVYNPENMRYELNLLALRTIEDVLDEQKKDRGGNMK